MTDSDKLALIDTKHPDHATAIGRAFWRLNSEQQNAALAAAGESANQFKVQTQGLAAKEERDPEASKFVLDFFVWWFPLHMTSGGFYD